MYVATIRVATPNNWITPPEVVFDWCNTNLEHPVSFVTTKQAPLRDSNLNYKIHKRKLKWKSQKEKLETIVEAQYDLFLTFQFDSKDDYALFVIRWGLLPNRFNYRLQQVVYSLKHFPRGPDDFLSAAYRLNDEEIEAKILKLIERA